jgi:hypothetical protein
MKRVLLLSTMMFVLSAWADDMDPMMRCDNEYAGCNGKCDVVENVTSECYCSCDEAYQKCLDIANGYLPEPSEPVAPKTEVKDTNTSAA